MKNLEQIRAAAAIGPAANLDRSAISKLPALILNNGLLAAIAFCNAEGGGDNRVHLRDAMLATKNYLSIRKLLDAQTNDLPAMSRQLSSGDALTLQRATSEALAFLSYLKRYSIPPKKQKREEAPHE